MTTNTETRTPASIAADLTNAANWLLNHPSLPTPAGIDWLDGSVRIRWAFTADADAEAIQALTDDDYWRNDHRYAEGLATRILTGRIGDRLDLWVVVERVSE